MSPPPGASDGRAVIVTGGNRGLGAALVQHFLDLGDRVATCSRHETTAVEQWGSDTSLGERFHYERVDLTDHAAADAFMRGVIDRFGAIDVLVNNAGVAREGVLGLVRDEDIDAILDVNLKGTIRVTRSAVRRMLIQESGRVINISSILGLAGYRGVSIYAATKAALDGFTRALARELGPRGITVNSVAPGYIETEMSLSLSAEQLGQIVRRTPLGRLADPQDVVAAVAFLASPEAAFISGQVLVVDGGFTA